MSPKDVALVLFLLTITAEWCCCTLPIFNYKEHRAYTDLENVCSESYYTLKILFYGLKMESSFVENGITTKPANVPEDSPCYGMKSTCCLSNEEKGMEAVVELEYHQKLQSLLERRLQPCNKLGRSMERSIYRIIDEAKKIIEEEVHSLIGAEIPKELFENFFQFLFRFIHVLDFCKLATEIELQMQKLYRYVVTNIKNELLVNGPCTSEELEKHFVSTWYNSSLNNLAKTMNILRLISETYQLTDSLVKDLKQHKFNRPCINALFKVRHCSYCIGNHLDITVCDGHCINTFRGCMVDMYELVPYFESLEERLQTITKIANVELIPLRLVQASMMEFIHMTRHIIKLSATPSATHNTTCIINDDITVSQIETDAFLHHVKSQHNTETADSLKNAIKKDLVCYNDVQSILSELDEEMCDINPKYVKYIRNKGCWNGNHSKGSYDHPLMEKQREAQANNPAFKQLPLPSSNSYAAQISKMELLIHEINQTEKFYECLKTDDEDCRLFVLECKASNPLLQADHDHEFQSGSGSGSGSGAGSFTHVDVEPRSRSILLHLGGPRRYNDMVNIDTTEDRKEDQKPPDLPVVVSVTNDTIEDNDSSVSSDYNSSNLYTSNNNSDSRPLSNESITPVVAVDKDYIPQTTIATASPTPITPEPKTSPPPSLNSRKEGGNSASSVYSSVLVVFSSLTICFIAAASIA